MTEIIIQTVGNAELLLDTAEHIILAVEIIAVTRTELHETQKNEMLVFAAQLADKVLADAMDDGILVKVGREAVQLAQLVVQIEINRYVTDAEMAAEITAQRRRGICDIDILRCSEECKEVC